TDVPYELIVEIAGRPRLTLSVDTKSIVPGAVWSRDLTNEVGSLPAGTKVEWWLQRRRTVAGDRPPRAAFEVSDARAPGRVAAAGRAHPAVGRVRSSSSPSRLCDEPTGLRRRAFAPPPRYAIWTTAGSISASTRTRHASQMPWVSGTGPPSSRGKTSCTGSHAPAAER